MTSNLTIEEKISQLHAFLVPSKKETTKGVSNRKAYNEERGKYYRSILLKNTKK